MPLWQETILLLAMALGLAVLIKAVLVQAFYIPSESMEPGLIRNDRILVQKVSYWFGGEPERGDVVVFQDPGGWLVGADTVGPTNPFARVMATVGLYPEGGHLVKRVVGVGGDTIECCDNQGRIAVNGEPLEEDGYIRRKGLQCNGPRGNPTCGWTAGPVPEGHVFVMGDNRGHSADSTAHMCRKDETDCVPGDEFVPVDLVVGKVFVLLWPFDRFDWIGSPDSFEAVPDGS
ncbi:signal peptidase I [Nocardioides coralli]|nr:signal peptidase I [Nocardioides coralli]